MTPLQKAKAFMGRNKKVLFIATALYCLAMIALVGFSMGPQTEPFVYQVR